MRTVITVALLLLLGFGIAGGIAAVDVAAQEKPKCVNCY